MQLDSLDIKMLKENFSDEEIAKMDALNIFKIFRYLQENNVDTDILENKSEELIKQGQSVIYVSKNDKLMGIIGIQDKMRDNMKTKAYHFFYN